MNLATRAARLANRVLKPAGIQLSRINPDSPSMADNSLGAKYQTLVRETHDCFSELVFRGLPEARRRIELLSNLVGTPVSEALYLVGYLSKALELPGEVCEFGIAQGATSALMANEIRETSKKLYLFDSFQGLGKPSEKDVLINDIFNLGSIEKYQGIMAEPAEKVLARLRAIDFDLRRVRLVPGFIEETIQSTGLPEAVSFAYLDLDFYDPTRLALGYLATHLSVGGTVIVDDYGFFSTGAKTAVDEFMEKHRADFEFSLPHTFAARSTPFCMLKRTR